MARLLHHRGGEARNSVLMVLVAMSKRVADAFGGNQDGEVFDPRVSSAGLSQESYGGQDTGGILQLLPSRQPAVCCRPCLGGLQAVDTPAHRRLQGLNSRITLASCGPSTSSSLSAHWLSLSLRSDHLAHRQASWPSSELRKKYGKPLFRMLTRPHGKWIRLVSTGWFRHRVDS